MKKMIVVILISVLLLAGCNYPTPEEDTGVKETSIAKTVDAAVTEDMSVDPTAKVEETESAPTKEPSGDGEPTQTPKTTTTPDGGDEIGEGEMAQFITDVTIPDYSELETGEEITKTWRIKNAGSTTWTTGYVIEYEKGEKLGAATQIPLGEEVAPGEMIDISIDFRVPTATGEYTSYWILKNEENQRVGVADEGKYLSLYMVILAVEDNGGGSSGGSTSGGSTPGGQSISGGAKITGATVSVDKTNYQGSCPAELNFSYTVTTSNAGKVQFNLVFNVISPSGYSFDPAPQYLADFTSGYTVNYSYLLFSNNSVTATARVQAVGANEYLSAPVQFTVKCQ